jgi:TetR/AcrR family transcriptional regulator, ethionamide resistance regulator
MDAGVGTRERGRRPARTSGDDRQAAILATAERLLAHRPISDISIDDLARGAGISRPTFYFYFASKDAVLLSLLDRVIEQAEEAALPVFDRLAEEPAGTWRRAIDTFFTTFESHRSVTIAVTHAAATNDEVRDLWSTVMEGWVQHTSAAIEAERDRGTAPPGIPARDLAIALNSMNERVLHATFTGQQPAIHGSDVVGALVTVWLTAIYHTPTPVPARTRTRRSQRARH